MFFFFFSKKNLKMFPELPVHFLLRVSFHAALVFAKRPVEGNALASACQNKKKESYETNSLWVSFGAILGGPVFGMGPLAENPQKLSNSFTFPLSCAQEQLL